MLQQNFLNSVSFSTYSSDEIRKISTIEIYNVKTVDKDLKSTPNGPLDYQDICVTCGSNYYTCSGHLGHIELPLILKGACAFCQSLLAPSTQSFNLIDHLNDPLLHENNKNMNETKNAYIFDYIKKYHLGSFVKTCPHCHFKLPSWKTKEMRIFYSFAQRNKGKIENLDDTKSEWLINTNLKGEQEFFPDKAKKLLKLILINSTNLKIISLLFGCLNKVMSNLNAESSTFLDDLTDIFFLKTLPVIPSKFRPLNSMGDSKFVSGQTLVYMKILAACQLLKEIMRINGTTEVNSNDKPLKKLPLKISNKKGLSAVSNYTSVWRYLQSCVNLILNNDNTLFPKEKLISVKQILEKKEGLFRKHMMGKRVDYAARSVISPDPFINVDQIGVPMVFATKLTFPEAVTPYNIARLSRAIMNGPQIYPGAFSVKTARGDTLFLPPNNPTQRGIIARRLTSQSVPATGHGIRYDNVKVDDVLSSLFRSTSTLSTSNLYEKDRILVVNRHLRDGDIVLLNRQPTLHKPSIMAHKAKVLPAQRTLRLHYAHCKAYNADFDGDEMNAHYPQDLLGVAEGRYISGCQDNYLTPKDGTPLTGLIQDHLVAGVLLSQRGQFFNRRDYQDLLYKAFAENCSTSRTSKRLHCLKPSILKPTVLWTGKQMITSILINSLGIERAQNFQLYTPKCKVSEEMYKQAAIDSTTDRKPLKSRAGAGNKTIKHHHLSEDGTCVRNGYWARGIFDKSHFGASPYGLIHSCQELYGGQVSSDLLTAFAKLLTCYLRIHGFTLGIRDLLVSPKADKKRKKRLKDCDSLTKISTDSSSSTDDNILFKVFGRAVTSEKKPFKMASAAILKQEWETAFYGRDQFLLDDWELQSKRFVDRINNDITEQIMNGLVKQFPTNNLLLMVNSGAKGSLVNCVQICSMLGQIELEGKRPPVLPTGRSLPSFQPFDPNPKTRGFVTNRFLTGLTPQDYFFHCMAGREGLIDTAVKTSHSGYLQRCLIKQLEGIKIAYDSTVRDSDDTITQFMYGEDGLEVTRCQYLKSESHLDFLLANHSASVSDVSSERQKSLLKSLPNFGGDLSINLRELIETRYKKKNCKNLSKNNEEGRKRDLQYSSSTSSKPTQSSYPLKDFPAGGYKSLRNFFRIKNAQSLVSPGEAVGVLAAQSIGEPSTQMTLNTFHFAGRGEMNVTLGIPRLREILMTATHDLKTPIMTVPLKAVPLGPELKLIFSRIPFNKVIKSIEVDESLTTSADLTLKKIHWVYRFSFGLLLPEYLHTVLPQSIMTGSGKSKNSIFSTLLSNDHQQSETSKELGLPKKLRKGLCTFVCAQIEKLLMPRIIKAIRREDMLLNNIKLFESRKKLRSFAFKATTSGDASSEKGAVDGEGEDANLEEVGNLKSKKMADSDNSDSESSTLSDSSSNADQVLGSAVSDGVEFDDDIDTLSQTTADTRTTASTNLTKDYPLHDVYDDEDEGASFIASSQSSVKRKTKLSSPKSKLAKRDQKSFPHKSNQDITLDDSGAAEDEVEDLEREHRGDSMPSSTTSGFSDMGLGATPFTDENGGLSPKKSEKLKITNEKIRDSADGYLYSFNYEPKNDYTTCDILIQIPLSDNKVDIEAILEKECKGFIYEIPGIHSSTISDQGGPETQILNVEGINFPALFCFGQYLDLNRLYCNDLHRILDIYGIEACRNAIIKEIQNVFSVYGIKVDYRHLSLVADYMTTSGQYKAFNRFSLTNNASPFLKMSFESTTNFLLDALVTGSTDNLQTPSACLVMGKDMTSGTGAFDLYHDLTF